jgi:hypothetical protein
MGTNGTFDEAAWREELIAHRAEKDRFFREHRQSPLPRAAREGFDGLAYYDPDPDYRVEATVEPADGDGTIEIDTTAGTRVEYERVAALAFELAGEDRRLIAYRRVDGEGDGLFVPFRDATSGTGTYGAGRYMEFEVDGTLDPGASVTLDFNLAYHPFCAYNDAFACPLPPAENRLDVRVTAGERLPEGGYGFAGGYDPETGDGDGHGHGHGAGHDHA